MVCFFNDLDTSYQHVWYIWGVFNDPSYDHYSLLQNVQNQTFRLLEDCDKSLLIHSLSAFDGCIYQQILRSKLLRDKLTPITAAFGILFTSPPRVHTLHLIQENCARTCQNISLGFIRMCCFPFLLTPRLEAAQKRWRIRICRNFCFPQSLVSANRLAEHG